MSDESRAWVSNWKRAAAGFVLCIILILPELSAQPTYEAVFSYLSLDYPGLEKVKQALAEKNTGRAKEELLRYFRARTNRIFDERVRFSRPDSARAYINAGNTFSFKAHSHAFGPKVDWSYVASDREWNFTLNRMEWFNNYVALYERTRDERLVRAWKDQIESWLVLGNPGYPRTIDTGRRMEAIVFSHYMFVTRLQSPTVDADFNARLLASIYEQCEFLYSPDHWRRFSNWGTFENSGFADAAVMFPEFKRSQEWLREIFFRMRTQLQLSYDADGMHIEVSPSYHAHELKVWCDFVRLTELNGIANPWPTQNFQPSPRDLLKPPAMALAYVVTPTGAYPQVGDTDRREEVDYLHFLAEFFNNAELKFVASRGREGNPPAEISKAFPETGYFILRSGWGNDPKTFGDQTYLLFDATINKPWHAHLDALNLLLTSRGKDLLIDPGRFTYNDGPEREQFLSTSAHNTIVINKTDQKQTDVKPAARWKFFESFDYVHAGRSQEGVRHERSVLFVKPDYAIVIDNLKGTGRNSYDQYWHLNPDATGNVKIENEGITTPDLVLASSLPISAVSIEKGAASYAYREKMDAPVARYSFSADGEATVMTVLHPRSDISETIRLKSPGNKSPGVFVVERTGGTDVLVLRGGSPSITSAGIETDAELVFLRRSNDGSVERILALNGSYLRFDGKVLFDSFGRTIDISSAGTRVTAKGVNISKLTVGLPGVLELVLNGEQTKTVIQNGLMIFD
jgi:hypothetical protein